VKRTLVTGGLGFIGSAFLRRFVVERPDIRWLNADAMTYCADPRRIDGIDALPHYEARYVDIAEWSSVEPLVAWRPNTIVHFAAETHVDRSIVDPAIFTRTNVVGTLNILRLARLTEARLHHVSTDEVFGDIGPDEPLFVESSRYNPSSPYAASKAGADHLVRAWGRTYGLPYTISHGSNTYGVDQLHRAKAEKLMPMAIERCLARRPITIHGDGKNMRDWLHVEDHVAGIWTALERGVIGESYNIGGTEEASNNAIVEMVIGHVARETTIPWDELWALRTYVGDRPGNDRRYALDTTKLRALGWAARRKLDEGVAGVVQRAVNRWNR
jgi:dTDP-glucose 4,6-dehydratase